MPVVIKEMTSSFDVKDEAKIRKMIVQEVKKGLAAQKNQKGSGGPDPADPAASGRPGEGT